MPLLSNVISSTSWSILISMPGVSRLSILCRKPELEKRGSSVIVRYLLQLTRLCVQFVVPR